MENEALIIYGLFDQYVESNSTIIFRVSGITNPPLAEKLYIPITTYAINYLEGNGYFAIDTTSSLYI